MRKKRRLNSFIADISAKKAQKFLLCAHKDFYLETQEPSPFLTLEKQQYNSELSLKDTERKCCAVLISDSSCILPDGSEGSPNIFSHRGRKKSWFSSLSLVLTDIKYLCAIIQSQAWGSLVGCRLWGRTESDTTEATYQQRQQQHFP